MSEWQAVNMDSVSELLDCLHKTPKYSENGLPMVRVTDVKNGYLDRSNCLMVNEDVFKDFSKGYVPRIGDIIFTRVGSYGQSAIVMDDRPFCIGQNTTLILPQNIDSKFIFYFLISPSAKSEIDGLVGGSTQPTISMASMRKIKIPYPSLPEQKAIAGVLSSLDDKIDLLNRQNKTLESMAETLFRQWFIEEAQDDWEEVSLGDCVECVTGVSYKSSDLNVSEKALVTLKNFARDGSFRMDGFKEYTGRFKDVQVVFEGDLVVSHTDITQEADIIGNPVLVVAPKKYKSLLITMDLMKVDVLVDWLSKEFLFYLFRTADFKFHCLGCSNGTTVLHMSRKTIPSYVFKLSNKEKVGQFSMIAKSFLCRSFNNIYQIQKLEELRDTLLPKLMSGEVRVK